jgi:arginine repressor
MTEPRNRRLRALAELIRAEPHASQEELTERLRGLGHQVTQATVSRDLVSLGA